jgi:hypothetical protein
MRQAVVAMIALVLGLGWYAYFGVNSDVFGLARPRFADWQVQAGYGQVLAPAEGLRWQVTYEGPVSTSFRGTVRHASPWRDASLPFMTHDILLTTGDFADPGRVQTGVFNHFFFWWAGSTPAGSIHLIHAVPASEALYDQLLRIRPWQTVTLEGREILQIDRYDSTGSALGYWRDAGCNSMLITAVR